MNKRLLSLCVSVLVLAPVTRVSATLIAHWPFNEGAGTVAKDTVGGGGDATFNGNVSWGPGVSGGGLQFADTGEYVRIENNAVVQLRSQTTYTVAVWVNVHTTTGGVILFHGQGCVTWASWFLGVGGGEGDATRQEGNLVFGVRTSSQSAYTSVMTPLESDKWVHVAATYDGTTLKLFKEGVEVGSVAAQQPYADTNPLFLGADPGCSGRNWFGGMIDDLQIFDEALSAAGIQLAMGNAGASSSPVPAAGATDVPRDTVLSWTAGQYAASHDVYFGTVFDDVNNAAQGAPAGVLVSQGQTTTRFDPAGLLAFGRTYYWRVDEVNAAPDSTIYKGTVWNFTAEPYGYPVTPVKATASSSLAATMGPEKTIDGSGLDAQDQHGTSVTQMWMSKKVTAGTPIWVQYEFDAVYKLYQMWVWNSNQAVEPDVGFGAKTVTVETSLDGTTWTALANAPEFAQATGEPNYVHNTTVDFAGVQAKFVKLTITSNWADSSKQASLSEVRFFYVPVKAYGPTPAAGAANVALDAVLNWRSGREAARHDVYVSMDSAAVANSTAPVKTVTEHTLALTTVGLEYARTYAWKVNEVNDAANPKSWEGDLWSFSTPEYGIVDDFESYDNNCKRIFFVWVDGYGHNGSADCGVAPSSGNGSGSIVGNTNPPFAERTVVHSGTQAMPLAYDNTTGKSFSEATRTFETAQDWTLGGAKTLVLYFHGDTANGAGDLYLKINDTKVTYSGGSAALTTSLWKQWNVDLASVTTNLKAVRSVSIGVSGSGKGILYVDDIRLYRTAPAVVVPANPGTNGLAALYKMEADVTDSSGKGNNGTAEGSPVYVDGPVGYGKALQFDGLDDDVLLPIGTLISTMTSCTVAAWVNLNTSNTGSWERVFDFGTSSAAGYMFLSPRQSTNGAMRFAITTTTNTAESGVNSPANLPAGWHHVAAIIDGTTMTMQLCLDGDVVASGPIMVLPKDLGKTTQNWLGRSQWTADAFFAGILDDFRIYTRALSTGEVRYLAGDR